MNIKITVETSNHPDFELFAHSAPTAQQIGKRGNRADIDAWLAKVEIAAAANGHTITVVDES